MELTGVYNIFVYGTLRQGDVRASYLSDTDSKFIKNTKTAPKYTLVSLSAFPAIIEKGNTSVVGELWEVDERTKRALDTIEGVPFLYMDKEIELEDGTTAIAYVQEVDKGYPHIESGDWFNI